MLDVHWSELLFIAVIALLILGPKDFVQMAHKVGQVVRDIKLAFYKMRAGLDAAYFEAEEIDGKKHDYSPNDENHFTDEHEVQPDDPDEIAYKEAAQPAIVDATETTINDPK